MSSTAPVSPALPPADLAVPELLNSLADGAYITDTNRRILCWNKAAERITGWAASQVVGHSCFDNILAHTDKTDCQLCGESRCPLHRSIITGQPSTHPILIFARRSTGTRIPVEVSVGPIRNLTGDIIGGIEVFRDLTESIQDLTRAKAIQEISLKSPLPHDERVEFEVFYEPKGLVGGDFYRIEQRENGSYALMLADAMGHGVAGALCAMHLRTLWDEHRDELDSPARFLQVINQRLHALVRQAGFFATAVCATYDPASGRFCCARAGHPSPLVFHADGQIETLGRSQVALGMLPASNYQETTLQLAPADTLLLFTDGATELFDPAETELGVAGLQQFVSQQTRASSERAFHLTLLAEQLLAFTNQIQLPDDLTLLKLRRIH